MREKRQIVEATLVPGSTVRSGTGTIDLGRPGRRKGGHPERHLREFRGSLQADAYTGFNQLHQDGRIEQAACLEHVRRHFYDLEQAHASPIAQEALLRIGALYTEEQIRGKPSEERRTIRQATIQAAAGFVATVVGYELVETLAQVGHDGCDSLGVS